MTAGEMDRGVEVLGTKPEGPRGYEGYFDLTSGGVPEGVTSLQVRRREERGEDERRVNESEFEERKREGSEEVRREGMASEEDKVEVGSYPGCDGRGYARGQGAEEPEVEVLKTPAPGRWCLGAEQAERDSRGLPVGRDDARAGGKEAVVLTVTKEEEGRETEDEGRKKDEEGRGKGTRSESKGAQGKVSMFAYGGKEDGSNGGALWEEGEKPKPQKREEGKQGGAGKGGGQGGAS